MCRLRRQYPTGAPAPYAGDFRFGESHQSHFAPRSSAPHGLRGGQPRRFGCLSGSADGTSMMPAADARYPFRAPYGAALRLPLPSARPKGRKKRTEKLRRCAY